MMIGRRGPGDGPLSFTAACAILVDAKPEFQWTCLISTNRSIPTHGLRSCGRKVPELIRKDVEQHVSAHLPAELLTKLRSEWMDTCSRLEEPSAN